MPSSVVAGIKYDKCSRTLRIIYVSGMMYDYKNVPEQIYTAMKTAFSKGTFLNKYIKGRYEFEKIEE
jgi:KTSC domain